MQMSAEWVRALGWSVVATILFIVAIKVLFLLIDRIDRGLERLSSRPLPKENTVKHFIAISMIRFSDVLIELTGPLRVGVVVMATYLFLSLEFSFFSGTQEWSETLLGWITTPVKIAARSVFHAIPNLISLLVIAYFTRGTMRLAQVFFKAVEAGRLQLQGFHPEWADPTYKLVRLLIAALALAIAFPYIPGFGSPAFQGISVLLGVVVSLGSSSAISNMVAGLVLTYMRPFRVGDRVRIGDTLGDVMEKNLLVTRVRTIKNVDVTIPNATILSGQILNYSATRDSVGLILNTTLTLGYETPWPKIHDLLIEAALATPGIESEPKPFVFQTHLNDYNISYEINATTRLPNQMASTYAELNKSIQTLFAEHQIEILSPLYASTRVADANVLPSVGGITEALKQSRHESVKITREHS